jgi:hypothetical protein
VEDGKKLHLEKPIGIEVLKQELTECALKALF